MPLGSFADYARRQTHNKARNAHHQGGPLHQLLQGNRQAARAAKREDRGDRHDNRGNDGKSTANASGGTFTHGNIGPNTHLSVSVSGGTARDSGGNRGGGGADHHERTHGDQKAENQMERAARRKPPGEFMTYASQNAPYSRPQPAVNVPGYKTATVNFEQTANRILDARNTAAHDAMNRHEELMKQYQQGVSQAMNEVRGTLAAGQLPQGGFQDYIRQTNPDLHTWLMRQQTRPQPPRMDLQPGEPMPNPTGQHNQRDANHLRYLVGPNGAPYTRAPIQVNTGDPNAQQTIYRGDRPEAKWQRWFGRQSY